VPAAAVIPAPVAHIFVAAVKTSVVGPCAVRGTVRKTQFSKRTSGAAWDTGETGTDDGGSIRQLEVKIDDLPRTLGSEGGRQGCIR